MRILLTPLAVMFSFAAAVAQASVIMPLEKVKTGILPSGGLYSVYNVTCHDESLASVVSTQRRGRWCVEYDGQLSCFREAQEASRVACFSTDVAASKDDLDALDAFQ